MNSLKFLASGLLAVSIVLFSFTKNFSFAPPLVQLVFCLTLFLTFWGSVFTAVLAFDKHCRFHEYSALTLKDDAKDWRFVHYVADKDSAVADMVAGWKASEVGLLVGDIEILKDYIDKYVKSE